MTLNTVSRITFRSFGPSEIIQMIIKRDPLFPSAESGSKLKLKAFFSVFAKISYLFITFVYQIGIIKRSS